MKIGEIIDVDGPITAKTKEFAYFSLPKNSKIHLIDTEETVSLLDLLDETVGIDEPLGIDCEWRPSMSVFHKAQGPSIM